MLFALWALQALAPDVDRLPWSPRYLFPVGVAILLVAAEYARGVRWSPTLLAVLYLICAVGLATNLKLLDGGGSYLRNVYAPAARADLAGLEIAGDAANPDYIPAGKGTAITNIDADFTAVAERGDPPTATYLAAVRAFGPLGFSRSELLGEDEATREMTDSTMVAALGLNLEPLAPGESVGVCRAARAAPEQGAQQAGGVVVDLPPGGAILRAAGVGGSVSIRRFADQGTLLGTIEPNTPTKLALPEGDAGTGWQLLTTARPLRICAPR